MKIYIITAGEYSDYHICGAWLDRAEAERYLPFYRLNSSPHFEAGTPQIISNTAAFAEYKKRNTWTNDPKYNYEHEASIEEFEIQGELPKLIEKLLKENK